MQEIEETETEPIFELALECETLYAKHINSVNDIGDKNASKVLSDLYQRFSAWAAFLGVFAESNVCLDQRLRRHAEIQDQVLRLLDIMRRNLACVLLNRDLSEPDKPESLEDDCEESAKSSCVCFQSLNAMSAALERLNQIGTVIRRSATARHASRARELAEKLDLASFEQTACTALRILYPDCSESLIDQLTRSMVDSYAIFLRRKSRKARLELQRPSTRKHSPLPLIREERPANRHAPDALYADLNTPARTDTSADSKGKRSRLRLDGGHYAAAQSEPTSIDTQEFKAGLKRLLSHDGPAKPVSILVNQVRYPRPDRESFVCEWCLGPLTPGTLDGFDWQKHINEDFKPYVCISEKCSQPLIRFASSTEWLRHMVRKHGSSWHREIHGPSAWICPLCIDEDVQFSTPDKLSDHLEVEHSGIFKESQAKAIVRQSQFQYPRPDSTCPLCSFSIGEEETSSGSGKERSDNRPLNPRNLRLAQDNSSSKHIRQDVSTGDESLRPPPFVHSQRMGPHVAAHLQNIMLYTMRLISLAGSTDRSFESPAASTSTGSQRSLESSSSRDLDRILEDQPPDDANDKLAATYDPEYSPPLVDLVPDVESIDWEDVPRSNEDPRHDDTSTHTPREHLTCHACGYMCPLDPSNGLDCPNCHSEFTEIIDVPPERKEDPLADHLTDDDEEYPAVIKDESNDHNIAPVSEYRMTCHACGHIWPRGYNRSLSCPQCDSDFTEIIEIPPEKASDT
ncbi:hypothetical protein BJY01DRAFT_75436 [Aspergillus pseudoustus]|uniref:C2H2-type domain-containing protein n=1 Tax=Aspergillus pseudoustus TaxID=1810923 RepID=A0ABR4J6C6_9EURO